MTSWVFTRQFLTPTIVALLCGAAGLGLAIKHPVAPATVAALVVVCWIVFFRSPHLWLLAFPALLPVIGLAPWTGWITFEEQDILILAIAAGGYMRMARNRLASNRLGVFHKNRISNALPLVLVGLFAVSTFTAMFRGFADSGGLQLGWFQGYHEPLNSLRLAKSFFEALLLVPLWRTLHQQDPIRTGKLLSNGLILGLVAASLAAVWERAAFTGLFDFSPDYRTTSLFWEMHVGGAALDGFLALTAPFAMWSLLSARTPAQWCGAASVCALAAYASLTTFSRSVYVAIPIGLAFAAILLAGQRKRAIRLGTGPQYDLRNKFDLLAGLSIVTGFSAFAWWMFPTSGYRGTAALLGLMAVGLTLADMLRRMPSTQWFAGGVAGVLLAAAATVIALLVPKGAYLAYGVGISATAWLFWVQHRGWSPGGVVAPMALAAFIATAAAVIHVSNHWGYSVAVGPAIIAVLACLALTISAALVKRPLWPSDLRWQAGTTVVMGLALGVIGIFGGGAFMESRFAASVDNMNFRLAHWKLGVNLLQDTDEKLFGKGMGRFAANFFLAGNPQERPGDYQIVSADQDKYLRLTSGLHMLGHEELFRVTQRIALPAGRPRVSAQIRSAGDVGLIVEVCEKHLLYSGACLARQVWVKGKPGSWQSLDFELSGNGVSRGSWYAPKLLVFSLALGTRGASADLDQIRLVGPDGRNLLKNGGFSNEMAHWFFSSDKLHMPWHMKNIFLHVLFDQGLVGVVLWSLMLCLGLVHLTIGRGRSHALAPMLAASLAGFTLVGSFDSLLDVPRLATLFYLLLLISLSLATKVTSERHRQEPWPTRGSVRRAKRAPATESTRTNALGKITRISLIMVLSGLFAASAVAFAALAAGRSPLAIVSATPAEWIRVAKSWLTEHDTMTDILLPQLERLQSAIERPPPIGPLPTLGKGQHREALTTQEYGLTGVPIPTTLSRSSVAPNATTLRVGSVIELTNAIKNVRAGQIIELAPGTYRINFPIVTPQGGSPKQPITVRASRPAEVLIEFATLEGFQITQPYWVFENLTIRGVCRVDRQCEHAFHIVGGARGSVIRNNRLEDFNAHIKINGIGGHWPDDGLVQFNTLTNSRPRRTSAPVTPIDLVAANGWELADNVISNFVKAGGDQISYGVFMKGGSTNGRIERNLIICTPAEISQPGNRVGLSWGGGGSGANYCRDKTCENEHTNGLAANNVIAHCNDAGVDVNYSQQITIAHNTLINTAGILLRGRSERVNVFGNLLEGRIRLYDAVKVTQSNNKLAELPKILVDPDRMQLETKSSKRLDVLLDPSVVSDFCDQSRHQSTWAGASNPAMSACVVPWQ